VVGDLARHNLVVGALFHHLAAVEHD
jgi:hypothetical protein